MTRTYRVRVADASNFLHMHDVDAATVRDARREAMRRTNDETGNAVFTHDVHSIAADGGFGALYFRHAFAS